MLREQPLRHNKILFFIFALLIGFLSDIYLKTSADNWIHDAAVIHQARTTWPHVGIVALDSNIPLYVGRKQALPLYAKATERLVAAGAKAVFLDARVFKGMERNMPYASCIQLDGQVRWSEPSCSIAKNNQCTLGVSDKGNAPLRMNEQAFSQFSIAPYLNPEEQDFLLYDWDAVMMMRPEGINASDRLVTKASPIARWVDLSLDHAAYRLANSVDSVKTKNSLSNILNDEVCDGGYPCRRVRLSKPLFSLSNNTERLILPLSVLASCDENIAMTMAAQLKDKAVILQLTTPTESTDIIVTAMTTAFSGDKLMTPGPQFIADEVETLLNQDHPRSPSQIIKYSLFTLIALLTVLAGAYLSQVILWLSGVFLLTLLLLLCFLNPLVQLWPVTASFLIFIVGACLTTGAHLLIGFRHGKLISNYMPYQIRDLLLSLPAGLSFNNHRCDAVILMSDLAGYTTVTGLLKEPSHVMNLMNDYLSETSIVLQDKYEGWLEAYVGDLVCYYWPYSDNDNKAQAEDDLGNALDKVILNKSEAYHHILSGALELAALQKNFFSHLSERYAGKISHEVLEKISQIINAGVGISSGSVVMGNLGPDNKGKGVKKFGILGDPLNLAARIEGLTRFFNTEIIITEELVLDALQAGFRVRRLGSMAVKGRIAPAVIFALGYADDLRFDEAVLEQWELWIQSVEQHKEAKDCPEVFQQDQASMLAWLERGLLSEQGIWLLDQK